MELKAWPHGPEKRYDSDRPIVVPVSKAMRAAVEAEARSKRLSRADIVRKCIALALNLEED